MRRTNFNKEKPLAEIERLRIALLKIPLYLTVTVNWLKQQNGIDTNRISLLGYSFGALVLPAVQHHLQETGFYPAATIISYGAVNIAELLEFNFSGQSTWLNPISSHLLQSLIYPIEPEMHLPELKGQFLLMNGKLDKRIPFQNALKLQELVRQPKTIINLDEGHMHPDKPELTLKIIRISKDWLFEKRLINQ
ncbi:MAG: prolyl oligopeptidase family serine peptidase [Calditrichaeota bacterium]|nr:prolyl oligopeptidase family serine peptidase [Calditrichota bacterium]